MDHPSDYRDVRVLVAEDNPVNQRLMSALLATLDVAPHIVGDGQAAVRAVEQDAFDLILMDLSMPVLDGLTAIRRIRALEAQARRRRTPIYVVSSHDGVRDLLASRAAGADGHLTKPIMVSTFIQVVGKALRKGARRAAVGPGVAGWLRNFAAA